MSTIASTNAFDKSNQSKERGITLDLGFSSFDAKLPDRLADGKSPYDALQVGPCVEPRHCHNHHTRARTA